MLTLLITLVGLMAGIYFAFSVFVMSALAQLPGTDGARAMNRINDVIVNTLFAPLFFGSTLWLFGLTLAALFDWQSGGYSALIVSAALIYLVGMFGVTAFGNVPLNNRLKERAEAAVTQADAEAQEKLITTWQHYLQHWTSLNHIRTISCIAACVLLILAA